MLLAADFRTIALAWMTAQNQIETIFYSRDIFRGDVFYAPRIFTGSRLNLTSKPFSIC